MQTGNSWKYCMLHSVRSNILSINEHLQNCFQSHEGKKEITKTIKKKNPEPNQIIQNRTKKKNQTKTKIRMWLIPFVTSRGHIHLRKPWLQQVGNFFARVACSKMKAIETTRRERRIEICRRNLQRFPPPHMLHQIALKTAETSWSCNCPWMVIRPRHFCWYILSVSNLTYIMPNAKMPRTNVCIFVC